MYIQLVTMINKPFHSDETSMDPEGGSFNNNDHLAVHYTYPLYSTDSEAET